MCVVFNLGYNDWGGCLVQGLEKGCKVTLSILFRKQNDAGYTANRHHARLTSIYMHVFVDSNK